MARPTKSVAMRSGHISKEEREVKLNNEKLLRGNSDNIKPLSFLTKAQKDIFKNIVQHLEESGLLGNIDVYVLSQAAITIDRIHDCERNINETGIFDYEGQANPAIKVKESYMREFFKLCSELSLSPQARAKIASINFEADAKKTDPLLTILKGGIE